MNTTQAMTVLRNSSVFGGLDDAMLDTLVFLSYTKEFATGGVIYTKGEPSNDRFGLILSGQVNIVTKQETVFKTVAVGHVIGEIALSDPNHKRTMTVVAAEPTEILEWDVNHVKQEIPGVWKSLVKLAWEHMREYYEEIE